MAVKIDNARSARPLQKGLTGAAVVYQELVEGGATRYMAMFVGPGDRQIGPVRSARPSDLQVLRQYGRVILGFSGANRGVLQMVHAADVIDVSQEEHGEAYEMHGRRPEAYNFYTTQSDLIRVGGHGATGVRDIGLRFGVMPRGGTPAPRATVTFNASSHAGLTYDATRAVWRLTQDGVPMDLADGTTVGPSNVVVQFVKVVPGQFVDVLGNNSPDITTVGTGPAWVFRDGRVLKVRWSRPSASGPTRLLDAGRHDVLLRPGQTWVMLVPTGQPVSVG